MNIKRLGLCSSLAGELPEVIDDFCHPSITFLDELNPGFIGVGLLEALMDDMKNGI